jgi:predicted nucleotidyltransferase
MNISGGDKAAIVAWARRHREIQEVWLYGSRARGDNRPDSDIDLAIVMDFAGYIFWHASFKAKPDLQLSHTVDLQWHHPNATDLEIVGPGVRRDVILLFRRVK